jgi:hypothetical protein
MSFSHTTAQILDRTKTVTRRLGWKNLKPGERFWAVRKAMGLKPGEKVERLALLECVSNRREPLLSVTDEDVVREGFPAMDREDFIGLFLRINPTLTRFESVQRIEFKYVEETR